MKAQAFLELVEETLAAQQDYFQAKRDGLIRAKDLLIKSKALEKRCRDVIKEGRLEPDEPTASRNTTNTEIFTEEGFRERMDFMDSLEAESGDKDEDED